MLNKFLKLRKSKKGFTLVELIVVIAILGILALIAIPNLGSFRETSARKADDATADVVNRAIQLGIASNKVSLSQTITLSSGGSISAEKNIKVSSDDGGEGGWIEDHIDDSLVLQHYNNVTFTIDANGNVTINIP